METTRKAARLGSISLLLILGGWLAACSESPPVGVTTENNLTDTSKVNNQSNLHTRTVRIEGAWNTPEVIGTERVAGSAQNVVSGPDFKMDQLGAAMVAWRTIQDPNPPNVIPGQFKTTVLRKNADSNQWLANSPIPSNTSSNTTQPELQVHGETGIAYATWYEIDSKTTFIRRFNPESASWGTAHPLNTNYGIQLILDNLGNATLIWPSLTNEGTEFHARRLTSSDSLGAVSTLVRGVLGSPSQGYATNEGTTSLFWFENRMGVESFNPAQLWSADYHPASGWGQAQQIPLGDLSITFPLNKITTLYDASSQTTAITFSGHLPLDFNVPANIYGLDNRSGIWSSPAPIDLNPLGGNFRADYALNHNGQMVAAWSELNYDEASNTYFYHVKARQYSAQTGWLPVETISDPLPLTVDENSGINSPEKGPQVAINNQGAISIIWSEDTQGTIDIFANHYSLDNGWGTQELLIRTGLAREFIQELDVKIDANGQTLAMWREVIRDDQGATHRMMLSRHNSGGNLTPPPPEPLPTEPSPVETPTLSFSDPVNVWNNAGQNNVNVNVRGPLIATAPSTDEVYLSLINNRRFNSLSQRYEQGENIILANSAGAAWTPITLPDNAVSAVEPTQLVFSSDGTAFLAWQENDDWYLSTSADKQNWSDPVLIANNVDKPLLLPDAAGNMSFVWQQLNNDSTIHLRRYFSGTDATAGLQAIHSLSFSDRRPLTSPISDAQGNISVTWLSTTATSQEITISTFSDDSQWRTSDLTLSKEAKTRFQLAHGPNNTRVLIATGFVIDQLFTHQLFASLFSETSGWQAWQTIDQNQGTSDTVMALPQIRENTAGQVMLLWTEKTRDANGQDVYHLISNTLDLVNSQPTWSTPQLIGTTFNPRLGASSVLQLANDGSAIVTWIDRSITQQVLRVNQYAPTTGWSDQPIDLISYTDPSSGFMLNLNMGLTNTGNTLVTWQQLIRSNRGGEFYIWALEGNF